jgi:hypothetical protein
MHHLGAMLENGRGASKNLSEAKLWYERAASLEYPPALNDLGRGSISPAPAFQGIIRSPNPRLSGPQRSAMRKR